MTTTATALPTGRRELLAGSTVAFSLKHFRVQTVHGTLDGPTGWVEVDDGRIRAHGRIPAATVKTGVGGRDQHLRTFLFRTKRHPDFELRVDAPAGPSVPATVWIKGSPSTVLVTVEPAGEDRLKASFTLDRRDAGLTWPAPIEAGGVAVGREVRVELELVLR